MDDLTEGTLADRRMLLSHPPRLRRGITELVPGIPPAAGASYSYPIGGAFWERIVALAATLTTSATAGFRAISINYQQGDGQVFSQTPASGLISASSSWSLYADLTGTPSLPSGTSVEAEGSVTDPGAFGGIAFTSSLPAGQYLVTGEVYLSGTVTAADGNNMEIAYGGASAILLAYPGVANSPVQFSEQIALPAAHTIGIQTIAAASGASAVYNAQIQATYTGPAASYPQIPDLILKSGYQIQIAVSGIQAGDQLGPIWIMTERYPSNYADGTLDADQEDLYRWVARALAEAE